jgi:uncharacterized membrane protein
MSSGHDDGRTADDHERLLRLENRLAAIEQRLGLEGQPSAETASTIQPAGPKPLPTTAQRPGQYTPQLNPISPAMSAGKPAVTISPTIILGWGGVAALVLASAYLIRLAIDSGFLTPVRQIGLAGVVGIGMIVTGMLMRDSLRRYASLLPAGGVAILFITVYGAHLYHGLIGTGTATVALIIVCALSIGLREFYENELYTFFAVVGSYTGPLLLYTLAARPLDLMIYFIAWDIVFCLYALRIKRRSIYLVAAYLAFIVFHASWQMAQHSDWIWAAGFQGLQFVLFIAVTGIFSARAQKPLTHDEAVAHSPALIFFYATEYALLYRHIPEWAPWLAIASVVPLTAAYWYARARLPEDARAGEQIVTAYAALVLVHAVYVELIPDEWRVLSGLVALLALGYVAATALSRLKRYWPLSVACGIIAYWGYQQLVAGYNIEQVVGWQILIALYAVALYTFYWHLRRPAASPAVLTTGALYLGHTAVMAGIIHLADSRLAVSIVWGLLAVVALVIAIFVSDRRLGRSSLAVFAGFAAKVLLFDLSGALPLVRIGCLVVLGVTMYAGGLLYQRIEKATVAASN